MNYEKVADILAAEKHGLCNGELIERNLIGQKQVSCAVGALLYRSGYTAKQIAKLADDLDSGSEEEQEAKAVLARDYDMNDFEIDALMELNDSVKSLVSNLDRQRLIVERLRAGSLELLEPVETLYF